MASRAAVVVDSLQNPAELTLRRVAPDGTRSLADLRPQTKQCMFSRQAEAILVVTAVWRPLSRGARGVCVQVEALPTLASWRVAGSFGDRACSVGDGGCGTAAGGLACGLGVGFLLQAERFPACWNNLCAPTSLAARR